MTMAGSSATRRKSRPQDEVLLDRELEDLPPELRWREWMLRVEAVIFAAAEPVSREILARVVGCGCSIDLIIDDLREDLRSRPYDIVAVAGAGSIEAVRLTRLRSVPRRRQRVASPRRCRKTRLWCWRRSHTCSR